MLKRIFLLSVMLLAAVGRPVKVSALTPEERFDSLMTEAFLIEDVHDLIVKLQEAEALYVSNNIDDSYREAVLNLCIGLYYYYIEDYENTARYCNRVEAVSQNYFEIDQLNINLKLLQCKYFEAVLDIESAIIGRRRLFGLLECLYGKDNPIYIKNAKELLMDYLIVGDYVEVVEICNNSPELVNLINKNLFNALYYLSIEDYDESLYCFRKYMRDNEIKAPYEALCRLALGCNAMDYPEFQRKSIESKRESVVDNVIHFAELQYSNEALGLLLYLSDFIPSLKEYPELTGDFLGLNLLRKGLSIHAVNELKRMAAQTEAGRNALAQIECINDSIREFSAGDGARIPQLQLRLEQCQRKLHTLVPDMDELRLRLNKGASDAYKALPEKAVGIDFIRYMVPDTIWHYGVFVYDGAGTPEFIDLFAENKLEERFKSVNYNEIEFFLDKTNTQLVWGNLLPIIEKYEEVYFSPDGLLNLFAIEHLLTDDDTTVGDNYKLHRVFHLADIEEPVKLGDYFVAFGVSRYNNSTQDDSGQIVADLDRGSFVDLPGVDKELENISNAIMGSRKNIKVSCIKDAEERQIIDFSGTNVTAMHFACHGFYIFSSDMEEAAADPSNPNYNISRRMHYYRQNSDVQKADFSGLLFRNGNSSWNSTLPLGRHDDLLTAEEVSDMYFPNLNLTVLSACESGFGVVDFDGVMGLPRAFRKAGTRSLICSQIPVNDNVTSSFMTTFYTLAARGATVRDAFVAARRRLQEDYPRRPDYWAAWILIE